MPAQDQTEKTEPLPVARSPRSTTRRNILAGVAGVGIAAAAGAGAAYAVTSANAPQAPTTKPVAVAKMAPNAMAGPLVVYLNDTTTGEMDVFGGTGQMKLRDPWLVSQLLKAMK